MRPKRVTNLGSREGTGEQHKACVRARMLRPLREGTAEEGRVLDLQTPCRRGWCWSHRSTTGRGPPPRARGCHGCCLICCSAVCSVVLRQETPARRHERGGGWRSAGPRFLARGAARVRAQDAARAGPRAVGAQGGWAEWVRPRTPCRCRCRQGGGGHAEAAYPRRPWLG